MRYSNTPKAFYNGVLHLNQQQQENPLLVLETFSYLHQLGAARELLHQLLQVALTSNHPAFKKAKAREAAYTFCQDLEELLEAVYLQQRVATIISVP